MSNPTPPGKSSSKSAVRAPGLGRIALELRVPLEFAASVAAAPWLASAPRGDGHGVIVYPGFMGSDLSTAPMRRLLRWLGHDVHGWEQGRNLGPQPEVMDEALARIRALAAKHGQAVSLVGWSLGGVYARELAKMMPDEVRGVITLGTPFSGSPKSTNAWRIYELTSGRNIDQDSTKFDLKAAPPVPTTSLFSRSDGIVAWQASIQAPCRINRHTENVEVVASHVGMGVNPAVWWVIADRLAHPVGAWKPFERKAGRLNGLIFPDPAR